MNKKHVGGAAARLMAAGGLWMALMPLAQAELKPQWELGAGVAGVDMPLYRGSTERRTYLLPTPFIQYRGDVVQVDRDRMRGLLYRRERVELDISVNGSTPVSSKDSAARYGMPDLDPTVEVGPAVKLHLYFDEKRSTNLDLELPVRSTFAVNFGRFEQVGWLFHPKLSLDLRNVGERRWNLGLSAAVLYGDRGYHAYFYDVASQYATSDRPAYSSSGGYAGSQFIASLSNRLDNMRVGAFVKWDNLNGAVFADSPLVTRQQSFTVGFIVAWVLWKSEKMVEVSDD